MFSTMLIPIEKVYRKEYQYREIEQEMHYMRRKLQTCIILGDRIPLYQLYFSETFGLMWSIDLRKETI